MKKIKLTVCFALILSLIFCFCSFALAVGEDPNAPSAGNTPVVISNVPGDNTKDVLPVQTVETVTVTPEATPEPVIDDGKMPPAVLILIIIIVIASIVIGFFLLRTLNKDDGTLKH